MKYINSIILGLFFFCSFLVNDYRIITCCLVVYLLFLILINLGKKILLLESIAFLYSFTCLLMPLVGYLYYTKAVLISRIWVKYMMVPEYDYFSFAFPAISGFAFALTLPLNTSVLGFRDLNTFYRHQLTRIKNSLDANPAVGLWILAVGFFSALLRPFIPGALGFINELFFFSSFAGVLYIIHSKKAKYRLVSIFAFLVYLLANALSSGMFTIVAYMSATLFSFILLGKKISWVRSAVILSIILYLIVVLQNVKYGYREMLWVKGITGSKFELFSTIFAEKAAMGSQLFETTVFFGTYTRLNQGFNVSLVMRRVPGQVDHDNGKYIMINFLSAFVPRFLWADKPEAGGKFNMKHYVGITLRGWSTNIGPLGEAYGAFGRSKGIIYMFAVGLFIRFCFSRVLRISKKIPVILFWIPVIFYQATYSAETDTLQIMNSLIKSGVFVLGCYLVVPRIFLLRSNEKTKDHLPVSKKEAAFS